MMPSCVLGFLCILHLLGIKTPNSHTFPALQKLLFKNSAFREFDFKLNTQACVTPVSGVILPLAALVALTCIVHSFVLAGGCPCLRFMAARGNLAFPLPALRTILYHISISTLGCRPAAMLVVTLTPVPTLTIIAIPGGAWHSEGMACPDAAPGGMADLRLPTS